MAATSQERLALGVVALLLAAGAGARALGHRTSDPPAYSADALSTGAPRGGASNDLVDGPGGIDALRARVKQRTEHDKAVSTPLAPGEKLDPNTATADELDRIPRVGHALAERIVQARTARGRFRTLADLDSVSGVGPGLLAQMAPHLTLPPAPPSDAPGVTSPRSLSSSPANGGTMQGLLSAPRAPRRTVDGPIRSASPGGLVDLNTATPAELEALPGIGPALAGKVAAWRAANGPFRSPEDLLKVGGIGPAKMAKLRPLVRVSP